VVIDEPCAALCPAPCATALMRDGVPLPNTGTLWKAESWLLKPTVEALARLWLTASWARMICVAPVIAT
jgi:hypothetical protein